MKTIKIEFTNPGGQLLVGRLEMPVDQHPHNFVLFAHCFTCTKNLMAVKNISRGLTSNGFGVLRFDFTGLGESEGDFADTNFSGNVEDLLAAAAYLKKEYQAPTVLVGHSLGGAAVIFAAEKLPDVKAVATIGAPSDPEHVTHLLKSGIPEIQETGSAVVNLGGRDFTIKKQFVDDLESNKLSNIAKKLGKATLIMHSPQDDTVDISNAERIYKALHHPKSFVTLDGADHLLSSRNDAAYVGNLIGNWALRYLDTPDESKLKTKHQVVARLDKEDGYTTQMKVGNHYMTADEPLEFGGNDFGPSPYEWVSAGLSACSVMTMHMYARRKGWDLQSVEVHTSYGKTHATDCEVCESPDAKIDTFKREIEIKGDLDTKQRHRLMEIADKCPVHRTLKSDTQIISEMLEG